MKARHNIPISAVILVREPVDSKLVIINWIWKIEHCLLHSWISYIFNFYCQACFRFCSFWFHVKNIHFVRILCRAPVPCGSLRFILRYVYNVRNIADETEYLMFYLSLNTLFSEKVKLQWTSTLPLISYCQHIR